MIPKFNFVVSEIEDTVQSSKTYRIDSFNGRITRKIDELEAIKQAVFKILQIERFENVIYDASYGVELIGLIGKPKEFVKSDIERIIKEALSVDERILGIENFNIVDDVKENLKIEFKVNSIYGDIKLESEVTI
ncbi:DUF2634 domain-containing protein [Clostridium perfringens]|uniref:DUF2634 domain-containing protein n=1 Tax=Clostridium perfringens TaxID=1502 RepID=UPI0028E14DEB|nr:DUF2634 domain-containing protein [Clostridium perfringens]MDT9337323.1 DUF2634 domain-containing protein [Clostridium perfringens]MDT9345079.1 DUF2634 domain-containing protein [Clostridium perfringens]MDT9348177.1 DUF2634 domain-containing protein [Clostridium perfringens]MDT9354166.1 DUF2634 domain-containing protein [Clostridium perfringens]